MHQVRIEKYTAPDRTASYTRQHYWQVLLPMAWLYFSSKRQMLAWFAELNRHLNEVAHETNWLMAELYSEFRYYYFHMDRSERDRVHEAMRGMDNQFHQLVNPFDTLTGNYVVYMRFRNIHAAMADILKTLHANEMNKLATVQRHRLQSLQHKLHHLQQKVHHFPTAGAAKIELREN